MRNPFQAQTSHEPCLDESEVDVDSVAELGVATSEPLSSVLLVTDVQHPTLVGRVRCVDDARGSSRWLPTLRGLSIRVGDRVLVHRPCDFAESVVVGVVDGLAPRERPIAVTGPRLSLLPDEALRIETPNGTAICEVRGSEEGPIVRLLSSDLTVETEGRLRFSARTIELEARQGSVRVEAADDVVVQGETIQLN